MKINFKTFPVFMLALFITACGGTPTPAPEKPATPLSTVPFYKRMLASINTKEQPLSANERSEEKFGNTPDEIVFVQGSTWTRTDNGHLIEINPATNSMISAIKIDTTTDPYHYCQGLGTDGENIWTCSAAGDADHRRIDVVRVDPSSRSITATVEVGKIFNQFDMPFLNDQIWVLSGRNGEKLVGIDVKTNQPNPAIELGSRCLQLTASGNALYAACYADNLVRGAKLKESR